MAVDSSDFYSELDQRLVAATRGIRLLASVSWPATVELQFIAAFKVGNAKLPTIDYPQADFADTRETLQAIAKAADTAHPLGDYIVRTAQS